MKTCECCQKEHDGSYGAGRFCNRSCAAKYVSNQNREDKNQKIGKSLNKRARFAEITCDACKQTVTKPWNRRKHRFCSKKCSVAYNSQDLEIKQKIRDARCKAIENGNIGFGIRCTFEGLRCDSALEYAFLKWYKQDHPNASIKRYAGKIESQGITFIPDFIIDDSIVVEVKYRKEAINYRLGSKWSGYIELQDKKKEILSSLGTDFIWFTDETCGQKFYRQCLKEVKEISTLLAHSNKNL
jgi:hypothetical protein